jgi:hypothetical protein
MFRDKFGVRTVTVPNPYITPQPLLSVISDFFHVGDDMEIIAKKVL